MDCFRVVGGTSISGELKVSGAKNATLPLMAASMLCEGSTVLRNVPRLRDTQTMAELIEQLGVRSTWLDGAVTIACDKERLRTEAPYELVRRMRASVCVLGPLLAVKAKATVSLPGGCVFGQRPIDIHLRAMEAFGAEVTISHGTVHAQVPAQGLVAAEVDLMGPFGTTVLGTANAMMIAVKAPGVSTLKNVAVEPEIVNLGHFLNASGAKIAGLGGPDITIEGVDELQACDWSVPPDRIEAGTLLLAAAATRGKLKLLDCIPNELKSLLELLEVAGVKVISGENWIEIDATGELQAVGLETAVYPGFPTDLQAQWMAFALTCSGRCQVEENVYPERFMHVAELNRLGANIVREGAKAVIEGPQHLTGAPVMASDLRASAALVIAGLAAEGETLIRRVYHLDRGYESLEEKLRMVGGNLRRCIDQQAP